MTRIKLHRRDITKLHVDAIVNAANKTLLGGGGVDGAIHRVAGKELLKECKALKGCETGNSKITKGYKLPAKYVIHTVGPVWRGGDKNEDELLKSCYLTSLKLAVENNIRTVAFPNISTGVYNYPKDKAAKIAIDTIKKFVKDNNSIEEIIFTVFEYVNYELYKELLNFE